MTTSAENMRRYYLDVMGVQCWQLCSKSNTVVLTEGAVAAGIIDSDNNLQQPEAATLQSDKDLLSITSKQLVIGRGNQSAELMFVFPALANSDDQVAAYIGGEEANTLFTKMLAAIHVTLDDIYITSLLTCKEPLSDAISSEEIKQCLVQLKQQIRLVQPKHLIVLGETTIRYLLQTNQSILRSVNGTSMCHYSLDDFRTMNATPQFEIESLPVFASYSPQELLQQPAHKRKAWTDLQQLQKMLASSS